MKETYLHAAGALAFTATIAACSSAGALPSPAPVSSAEPVAEPSPTPPPPPPPAPPPPAPVVVEPEYENYLDAPQTPGTWFYEDEPSEKLALFGEDLRSPVFLIRCAGGEIGLARVAATPGEPRPRAMSVTTESVAQQLEAMPLSTGPSGNITLLVARLDPADPLLDAMAITKGRFAIEVEGERTLYLPAWAEVTRVIEDCR